MSEGGIPYTFRLGGEEDFASLADLFDRFDYGLRRQGWLYWKYRQNPDGPARVYIAEDRSKRIVGMLAHLPRRFASRRTGEFIALQSVDVFVHPGLRNKGIYSNLSAFARARSDVPKVGFPNELSIRFGLRAGWRIVAPLRMWQFPVSASRPAPGWSVKVLARVGDLILRGYAGLCLASSLRDLEMRPVKRFEQDYVPDTDRIHGVRSAEFLNWRFLENPTREYRAFEFLEQGKPIGYCVYGLEGTTAEVFDLLTNRRSRGCVRLFVAHCRAEKITHLSFRGIGLRMWRLGFFPRGRVGNFIAYKIPEGEWMVTLCDSDW